MTDEEFENRYAWIRHEIKERERASKWRAFGVLCDVILLFVACAIIVVRGLWL